MYREKQRNRKKSLGYSTKSEHAFGQPFIEFPNIHNFTINFLKFDVYHNRNKLQPELQKI